MVVDLDLAGMDTAEQIFLLFPQCLAAILGTELEGGFRFGDKAGHAAGHLHTPALGMVQAVIQVHHLLGGVGNALDVLHRLGGQAHHEIELDRGVAFLERDGAGALDLLPGDVFC